MGCGDCCSKYILYFINLIFILGGAAILGAGIFLKVDPNVAGLLKDAPKEIQDALDYLSTGAIVLIVFGACVFLVAICGCCGVMMDNQCLLGLYITFISIVIAAELGAGIFVYVKKDEIESFVKKPFVSYLRDDFMVAGKNLSDGSYIFIMQELKCCGWTNEKDFGPGVLNATGAGNVNSGHPLVCCKATDDYKKGSSTMKPANQAACANGDKGELFTDGCYTAFLDFFSKYSTIAIAVGAAVAGLEVAVLLSAICYCCKVRSDKD